MINVIARVVAREYWEIIADNLKKPDGIAAVSQVRITRGDNFGLWPQSVARLDALLCMPMKCAMHFWNYRPRFIVDLSLRWEVMRSSMFC
jgi:hypothetical protein